jgi:SAM-dependent methyltransferase
MVNQDEVTFAYRFLFGRDPENSAVIGEKLGFRDWMQLREHFIRSSEFRVKMASLLEMPSPPNGQSLSVAPIDVDVDIPADLFEELSAHVKQSWETMGNERPHWSVITSAKYEPENIGDHIEEFYASGAAEIKILDATLARAKCSLSKPIRVFELGCGVGRLTQHLSKRFDQVTACDVSAPHLELAKERVSQCSLTNVNLIRFDDLGVLRDLPPFDLFYSIIVLQHNPPPLMYAMLKIIFSKLAPNGLAYFQIPVYRPGYRFKIDEYLEGMRRGVGGMEMHILPQMEIFHLFAESGMTVREMLFDDRTGGDFLSASFLAQKN